MALSIKTMHYICFRFKKTTRISNSRQKKTLVQYAKSYNSFESISIFSKFILCVGSKSDLNELSLPNYRRAEFAKCQLLSSMSP